MKFKRRYLLILIVLMGILVVSQVRSLLANYNIVEDMTLTTSMTSLKEGETLAVSVTDSNIEDTKLVIPVDENTEYMASDYQDASVVFDQINHQVVIDWLEPSKEQKEVTVQLKMTKEGSYPLKALTVRENQEVSTKEENIEVIALEESKEEPKEEPLDTEISESSQESSTEESTAEKSASTYGIKNGVWGTAPYEFNEETGELKVSGGELTNDKASVWQNRGIDSQLIKKITFLETVKLPSDSDSFFGINSGQVAFSRLEGIIGWYYLDTSNVTTMEKMFESAALTELDVSNFDTSNVTSMKSMFNNSKATELDVSSLDTSNVTTMESMFSSTKATELDVSSLDTSNVTTMKNMFSSTKATELDVSSFNTSNVTNMKRMFAASNVTKLDVSNFDTSKVTDMSNMFTSNNVTKLDVSHFDTSNVTDMSTMFHYSKATELDVSSFNTSKVTDMSFMFSNTKVTELDLSRFDTSNVTDMKYMFNNSIATELDFSNFDTSNVTTMDQMFRYVSNLNKLKLGSKFRFLAKSDLPRPKGLNEGDKLTGKWVKEDVFNFPGYTPGDFTAKYGIDEKLTAGTYVAETIRPGHITGETKLSNQTHSDGL
ncbi:BspA family leucine-rich repeat surface protein, partial [Carnobacterium maltaromaticum]|uniref:BspA family leucine-rich repeat surface protein n=1 Tax=Carnobacterium maltaromaticum TaxID=2751 RepID=UPI00191BC16E